MYPKWLEPKILKPGLEIHRKKRAKWRKIARERIKAYDRDYYAKTDRNAYYREYFKRPEVKVRRMLAQRRYRAGI